MNLNSRIFVAGSRGLVGSAIVRRLKKEGYSNILAPVHSELELMDQQAVSDYFEKEKPEYVFLAAAKVGGIMANNTYPADFIYRNLMIQNSIIHQSFVHNVKKLLFLGSSCIYPKHCPQPMKEEYLMTGPLEPTNSPYAVAKIAGIEMCHAYNRQYSTHYLAVMPTNLYGPNDNFGLENSHVLPAFIRKFHLAKLATKGDWESIQKDEACYGPIPDDIKVSLGIKHQSSTKSPIVTLWGTGTPRREFLYVDDLADACVFLMKSYDIHTSYLRPDTSPLINIGTGKDQTIKELAEIVARVVGFEGKVEWDSSKPDGTLQKLLDVSLLSNMGWKPNVSLKDGIRRTYEAYLATEKRN